MRKSRGFTYVDWNVCAEDSLGGHPSASTIYNNIIREVGDKNTCVVLMHDTHALIKEYHKTAQVPFSPFSCAGFY